MKVTVKAEGLGTVSLEFTETPTGTAEENFWYWWAACRLAEGAKNFQQGEREKGIQGDSYFVQALLA